MTADSNLLVPFRLRTVRLGVQATWLALALLPLLLFLPAHQVVDRVAFAWVWGVAAVGAGFVRLLPWAKLFERGWGIRTMYLWSGLDIILITLLLAAVGPDSLDIFSLYALTTLFFAASYPPRGQAGLVAFTFVSYLTLLAATGWPVPAGSVVVRLGILGVMTYLASFLSRELMSQIATASEAHEEADRRASLLKTVARAARSMSFLDSDRVLDAVVDATRSLGFHTAAICFVDEGGRTYHVEHPRGLPKDIAEAHFDSSRGVVGRVLARRATVAVEDYSRDEHTHPELRGLGFRSVIGSPVWSQGRLTAVLTAASLDHMELTELEREALELLAAQAGRALENAEQFEAERRAVARMEELDHMKQDFLSSVSHEIRTPLTVIEGTGLTLEQHWDNIDDTTKREFLKAMNENSRTLEGIVSKLLDFSRLETGKLEVHPQRVEIRRLMERVTSRLSDLIADHVVMVEARPGVEVIADPLLLDRVIENLLSNAAKYTPRGTGILLTAEVGGTRAAISVADHGPGIPPEELARLGERFFRGGDPNSRPTKGIGLGLALTRQFLVLHGSDLQIESEPGRGSRFWFSLPVHASGPGRHASTDRDTLPTTH